MVDQKIYKAGFIEKMAGFDRNVAMQRLTLRHEHQMKFVILGMALIILGTINFLVGYMFFDYMFMKTFSISVVTVLAGIIIFGVGDQELRETRKQMKTIEIAI
jgi:hypothetical protein